MYIEYIDFCLANMITYTSTQLPTESCMFDEPPHRLVNPPCAPFRSKPRAMTQAMGLRQG